MCEITLIERAQQWRRTRDIFGGALDMGLCIATGVPWAGQYETKQSVVGYIDFNGDDRDTAYVGRDQSGELFSIVCGSVSCG